MTNTMTKTETETDLAMLRDRLLKESSRLEHLLEEVEQALSRVPAAQAPKAAGKKAAPPAATPLDEVHELLEATADLRVANGNLSATAIASAFGVSVNQLAGWLGRSRQALAKTPDADSLQDELAFFERVARLRSVVPPDQFLMWLRMPHDLLDGKAPLDLMTGGERQVVVDFVEDMLTGSPT
jgi:hypothetical protein